MLTLKGNPDRLLLCSTGGSFLRSLSLIFFILRLVLLHLLVTQIKVISLAHCVNVGSVAETKRVISYVISTSTMLFLLGKIFFSSLVFRTIGAIGVRLLHLNVKYIFFVFLYFKRLKNLVFMVCNGLL